MLGNTGLNVKGTRLECQGNGIQLVGIAPKLKVDLNVSSIRCSSLKQSDFSLNPRTVLIFYSLVKRIHESVSMQ